MPGATESLLRATKDPERPRVDRSVAYLAVSITVCESGRAQVRLLRKDAVSGRMLPDLMWEEGDVSTSPRQLTGILVLAAQAAAVRARDGWV